MQDWAEFTINESLHTEPQSILLQVFDVNQASYEVCLPFNLKKIKLLLVNAKCDGWASLDIPTNLLKQIKKLFIPFV